MVAAMRDLKILNQGALGPYIYSQNSDLGNNPQNIQVHDPVHEDTKLKRLYSLQSNGFHPFQRAAVPGTDNSNLTKSLVEAVFLKCYDKCNELQSCKCQAGYRCSRE